MIRTETHVTDNLYDGVACDDPMDHKTDETNASVLDDPEQNPAGLKVEEDPTQYAPDRHSHVVTDPVEDIPPILSPI